MSETKLETIAANRKAHFDYFVLESMEAGMELCGTEVKSVRGDNVNLKDAWCDIQDGELYVKQMHISPYEKGNIFNKDPIRPRKLLMHKKEIMRIFGMVKQQGVTIIPLSVYFKGSLVKMQIGICKGKKNYDKRETMAKRDANRAIDRAMKEQNR